MELHYVQLEILRELLFNPATNFSSLNTKGITSDLFAYHIKQLIQQKLIEKNSKTYKLTAIGKEYANRLDVDTHVTKVEKQGKVGVIIHAFHGKDQATPMVMQTRLKEPFYGFKGGITGKIKYGETVFDTAKRELLEETGLRGDFSYHGVVHHINVKGGDVVEDKYLFALLAFNCVGTLIESAPGMSNEWVSFETYRKAEPLYEGELDIVDMCLGLKKTNFIEVVLYPEVF